MADAKLTALTAASALAAADLFYVSQSAASRKATGTQLLALVGTAYVPLTGGASMVGPLSIVNSTTQQIVYVYNTADAGLTNYERLKITGVAGTSVNITAETLGTGGDNLDIVLTPAGTGSLKGPSSTYIDYNGIIYTPNVFVAGTTVWAGASLQVRLGNAIGVLWSSTAGANGTVDSGIHRNAAGVLEVNNGTAGTYRDLKLRNLLNTEYHQMTEMTAPSAPAANSVRIYAEDNGAGKTRLMALFATGSAVQIAIEP